MLGLNETGGQTKTRGKNETRGSHPPHKPKPQKSVLTKKNAASTTSTIKLVPKNIMRPTKHTQILRIITTTIPFRMNMIDLQIESTSAHFSGSGVFKLTAALLLEDDLLSLRCQRMPAYFRNGRAFCTGPHFRIGSGVSECGVSGC
jgi:hypothetical protein